MWLNDVIAKRWAFGRSPRLAAKFEPGKPLRLAVYLRIPVPSFAHQSPSDKGANRSYLAATVEPRVKEALPSSLFPGFTRTLAVYSNWRVGTRYDPQASRDWLVDPDYWSDRFSPAVWREIPCT